MHYESCGYKDTRAKAYDHPPVQPASAGGFCCAGAVWLDKLSPSLTARELLLTGECSTLVVVVVVDVEREVAPPGAEGVAKFELAVAVPGGDQV